MEPMDQTFEESFWKKADTRGGGCWEWMGTTVSDGYGYVYIGDRPLGDRDREYAHRVAYQLGGGVLSGDDYVLHSCDNPPCVNPDHLRSGTASENTLDAIEKGRQTPPDQPDNSGENHGGSVITEEQAAEIKKRYQNETAPEVASDYPISEHTVRAIGQGRRWGHLPPEGEG